MRFSDATLQPPCLPPNHAILRLRTESSGLAGQMQDWIVNGGAKGPPPPGVNPATDFVYFHRPTVLSGRTYRDLIRIDALLAGR